MEMSLTFGDGLDVVGGSFPSGAVASDVTEWKLRRLNLVGVAVVAEKRRYH
jgi:hypothetical protein